MTPDTLAIILHFGSLSDTVQCIESLHANFSAKIDIFVIDNGQDPSVKGFLEGRFDKLVYRKGSRELGFAASNNVGLLYSLDRGYAYSLLLNNDTIAETDFLAPLRSLLQRDPSIAMIGPLIYCYPEQSLLWSAGGWINMWSGSMGGLRPANLNRAQTREVDYLPGACILTRNAIVREIGLMNEDYFLGVEEADLALRARKAGYKIMVSGDSVLYHKVGVSSRRDPEAGYNSLRNRLLFLRDNHNSLLSTLLISTLFLRKMAAGRFAKGIYIKALKDHFRYRSIRRSHLDEARALFAATEKGSLP